MNSRKEPEPQRGNVSFFKTITPEQRKSIEEEGKQAGIQRAKEIASQAESSTLVRQVQKLARQLNK